VDVAGNLTCRPVANRHQARDGQVRSHIHRRGAAGFGVSAEHVGAVSHLRDVALGLGQVLEKAVARRFIAHLVHEIEYTACVLHHLYRLDPRDIGKEPAATREHQHGVALHLEQGQRLLPLPLAQTPAALNPEKLVS
jgi:hypothetical protein